MDTTKYHHKGIWDRHRPEDFSAEALRLEQIFKKDALEEVGLAEDPRGDLVYLTARNLVRRERPLPPGEDEYMATWAKIQQLAKRLSKGLNKASISV